MTGTGSISVSGLLGGTAGSIDTTSLISSLMSAQQVPQSHLKDQLAKVQNQRSAYLEINTNTAQLQDAAQAINNSAAWNATAATSSSPSVVATSTATASVGATSFDVVALARAQITTVAADSSGNVVSDSSAGLTITGADGGSHHLGLTSGSVDEVAAAINSANVGVRASVISTDGGKVLQMFSTKSGTANSFSTSGFQAPAQNVVTAQDARLQVGDPAVGGYTVSSSSNTFSSFIPGVTFSVGALASNVTISVSNDESGISGKVAALVAAANTALTTIKSDTGQGALLQGKTDIRTLASAITANVSQGTSTGASLKAYGIDLKSDGTLTFDAQAFANAYASDPTATTAAVQGFATGVGTAADSGVNAVTGSVTASIASLNTQQTSLNKQIDTWTTRLATIQTSMESKYNAMESALAKLQGTQTYLTSMLKSLNSSSSSGS